jgi:phospholipid/cholesterol/gamma-HCH transport system substrate-binding protein
MSVKGFTGFGYMALQDVGDDLAPLVAEPGQPYPVIKSGPSVYLRIDAAVAKINKSVQQVSDAVAALLDKENLDSIKQTLLHIRDLTATLAGNGQQINTILHNTANASQHFAPAMQTFQAETIPSLNETIANFATVGQDLSAVATELKQNPAVLIRGKTPRAPGPGE